VADTKDLLSVMRKRLTMAINAFSDSREDELDDLKFSAGSPDNQWQWPADVLGTRGSVNGQTINARPCLTINKLPQHILQVTNDQRQNRPAGKVRVGSVTSGNGGIIMTTSQHAVRAAKNWSRWGRIAAIRYCRTREVPTYLLCLARMLEGQS